MKVYYFYKICSLDNEYIYIGSTRNLRHRISQHKSDCNNNKSKKYNYKLYLNIRQNGGLDNFYFDIIESINTNDKEIVLKQEQYLMNKYNSNLNTNRAFLSEDEKKQYNRQYNNQYRIDNNEIINNKKKEKFTCACNGRYTKTHKAEHLKSKKHKQFEQQEIINNKTYNSILFFKIFS